MVNINYRINPLSITMKNYWKCILKHTIIWFIMKKNTYRVHYVLT